MAPFWKTASGQCLLDHTAEAMNANRVHQGCYFVLSCCIFFEVFGVLPKTLHVMIFTAIAVPLSCTTCVYKLYTSADQHQYHAHLIRVDAHWCEQANYVFCCVALQCVVIRHAILVGC